MLGAVKCNKSVSVRHFSTLVCSCASIYCYACLLIIGLLYSEMWLHVFK